MHHIELLTSCDCIHISGSLMLHLKILTLTICRLGTIRDADWRERFGCHNNHSVSIFVFLVLLYEVWVTATVLICFALNLVRILSCGRLLPV